MTDTPPEFDPILPEQAPPAAERPRTPWRLLAWSAGALVLPCLLVPLLAVASLVAPGPLARDKTIVIAHGSNPTEIGTQLDREGAVYHERLFRLALRSAAPGSLKAGEYALPAHISATEIVKMMQEGRSVVRLFTVPEGLTSAEIVRLLQDEPVLSGTIDAPPPEGSLLPETYRYSYGDSRSGLVARMRKAMQDALREVWASRAADLPIVSEQQALILASIVEKETGKTAERPRIAGVFYNRLRQNMRLQSDPTVIYALTHGQTTLERALTRQDLALASPFNTYTSEGLPPQPICNPGRAALKAVAQPERNAFLYFVANGEGGHAFAEDLATHNANVARWRQLMDKESPRP